MPSYDKLELPMNCPNQKCKRPMKVKYYDVLSSRKAKCGSCGAEILFNSNATSHFKNALDDIDRLKAKHGQEMERAEEKVQASVKELFANAEVKMKM